MEWGGERREKKERGGGEKGKTLTGASTTLRTTSELLLGAHCRQGLALADPTFTTFSWVSKFTLTS